MVVTDPIADLLTRVRNAGMAGHATVGAPLSKLKTEVARVLKEEGYVADYWIEDGEPYKRLMIRLKYGQDGRPVITGLRRISKPGQRKYAPVGEIPQVLDGYGVAVLSTSKGVMTGRAAQEASVGGEILCTVW